MDNDIYKAPEAILDSDTNKIDTANFYVVGMRKFTFLYMLTLGLYSIYWFYRNWAIQKQRYGLDAWPVMRGLFQVFFTHSLCSAIADQLAERKITYTFHGTLLATLYVLSVITFQITDRFIEDELSNLLVLLLSLLIGYGLLAFIQLAINTAEEDPKGVQNRRLTVFNILWAIPGVLFYLLLALGMSALLSGVSA